MTPAERDTLAEALVPVAGKLAGAVHARDAERVGRILNAHGDHLQALAVVLADMIPEEDRLAVLDIDEVAVRRRLEGDKSVKLNQAEQEEAVRTWEAAGKPLNELERLSGINAHRIRKHDRGAA